MAHGEDREEVPHMPRLTSRKIITDGNLMCSVDGGSIVLKGFSRVMDN